MNVKLGTLPWVGSVGLRYQRRSLEFSKRGIKYDYTSELMPNFKTDMPKLDHTVCFLNEHAVNSETYTV